MSTRDYAVSVLASLSEEKMLEFIKLFADENVLARMETDMLLNNSDTISAIQEVNELKNKYNRKNYWYEVCRKPKRVLHGVGSQGELAYA